MAIPAAMFVRLRLVIMLHHIVMPLMLMRTGLRIGRHSGRQVQGCAGHHRIRQEYGQQQQDDEAVGTHAGTITQPVRPAKHGGIVLSLVHAAFLLPPQVRAPSFQMSHQYYRLPGGLVRALEADTPFPPLQNQRQNQRGQSPSIHSK